MDVREPRGNGAAHNGHTEVCKLLLKTGKANVKETTPYGFTPLLRAVSIGHSDVCELLLANGSDLEEREPDTQHTALHEVEMRGYESLFSCCSNTRHVLTQRTAHEVNFSKWPARRASVVTLLQALAAPLMPDNNGQVSIHSASS